MASNAVGNLAVVISANATQFDRTVGKVADDVSGLHRQISLPTPIDLRPPAGFGADGLLAAARAASAVPRMLSAAGPAAGALGGPAGVAAGVVLAAGFEVAGKAADALLGVVSKIGAVTLEAGGHAVRLAADFEQTAAQFKVLTGSRSAGDKLLADLDKLALRTPFDSKGLQQVGASFLARGIPRDSIVATLSRLGDIAAGDTERLKLLGKAFGDVLAKGRMQMQEVNQFSESGLGLPEFAKTAGMSTQQFMAAMEAGRVGADVMVRTVNRLTDAGGRFYGMNAEGAKTVSGQWNALTESLEVSGRRIGLSLFGTFDVAGRLGRLADDLQPHRGLGDRAKPELEAVRRGFDTLHAAVMAGKDTAWPVLKDGLADLKAMAPTADQFADGMLRAGVAVGLMVNDLARLKRLADQVPSAWPLLKRATPAGAAISALGVRYVPSAQEARDLEFPDYAGAFATEFKKRKAEIDAVRQNRGADPYTVDPIPEPAGPPVDSLTQRAAELREEFTKADHSLGAFLAEMGKLNQLLAEGKLKAPEHAHAAGQAYDRYAEGTQADIRRAGGGRLAEFDAMRAVWEQARNVPGRGQQADRLLFQAFQDLEKTFQQAEVKIPAALVAGTQEAEAAIARALTRDSGEKSGWERVATLLERVKARDDREARDIADIAAAFRGANPAQVVKIK